MLSLSQPGLSVRRGRFRSVGLVRPTDPPGVEAVTKLNNFVTYGGRSPGEAQYVVVSKEEFRVS